MGRECRAGLAAILPALVCVACAGDAELRGSGETDLDALPQLTLVEQVRIGSLDDPDAGFTRPGSAVIDGDGNLFVYEAQDRQVRVYDPDGRLLRRIGGAGEGPGEFSGTVLALGVAGDTLWTVEQPTRRLTLFRRSGELISAVLFDDVRAAMHVTGQSAMVAPTVLGPDGVFIGSLGGGYATGSATATVVADTVHFPRVRFDAEGHVVDTIGTYPIPRLPDAEFIDVGKSTYVMPAPNSTQPMVIPVLDGVIRIEQSVPPESAHIRVTRLGHAGDTLRNTIYTYRPRPYPDAVLDSAAIRVTSGIGRMYMVGASIRIVERHAEDSAAARTVIRAKLRFPDVQAPVRSYEETAEGALWLLREDAGTGMRRWNVFDASDAPIGTLETGPGLRILAIRDSTLWAVEHDAFDVPWVVRYTVR